MNAALTARRSHRILAGPPSQLCSQRGDASASMRDMYGSIGVYNSRGSRSCLNRSRGSLRQILAAVPYRTGGSYVRLFLSADSME